MAVNAPERTRATVQDWLDYPYEGGYVELIEAELIAAGGAKFSHQFSVMRLLSLIDQVKPNGVVLPAPYGVKLDDENIPEPDILWVSQENIHRITEHFLNGPPDLIVEVLSRSTAHKDWNRKFHVYERSSVREYWIVDTADKSLHVFSLVNGAYTEIGTFAANETFMSPVLGVQVNLTSVFAASSTDS
jgi:Uma2 family endonuclease